MSNFLISNVMTNEAQSEMLLNTSDNIFNNVLHVLHMFYTCSTHIEHITVEGVHPSPQATPPIHTCQTLTQLLYTNIYQAYH
jgi:hypothetical protein